MNSIRLIFNKLYIKDKSFYKTIARIAIPIAFQSLITTGVNMMDTIMISSLGETELSGVSLANQFIVIFIGCCMGIGMGASVLVSRYYGMREPEAIRKTIAIMIRLSLVIATVFCIATIMVPRGIMRIYTPDKNIIEQGSIYFKWSIISYFLMGLSLTCTLVLRAVGKVKLPLFVSIAAFFINVGSNYVFIFGKFGMPEMRVAGAAVGTLIARIFEFVMICGYIFIKDTVIGFRLKHLFMKTGSLWKEYIRISLPVLISDFIFMFGNNVIAMVIGRLGESFVAANAVTTMTQQLSSVLTMGMAQAAAIVTGYVLGEGNKKKAQSQGYALLGLGIAFGMFAAMVIRLISDPMIRAYNVSDETAEIARQLMSAISIIVLFQSTNTIMTKGTLRGGGDTLMLMVTDNVFLWVLSIPLGILAGFVFNFSAFWIYTFLKIDQVAKAIWCVKRLRSGKVPEDTFIGGFSMGGFGAIHSGLVHPEAFGKMIGLSSALICDGIKGMKPGTHNPVANYAYYRQTFGDLEHLDESMNNPKYVVKRRLENGEKIQPIFMACGSEDFLVEANRDFRDFLLKNGVDVTYKESPGVHDWNFWNEYIEPAICWALES